MTKKRLIIIIILTSLVFLIYPKTIFASCNFYSQMTASTKSLTNFNETCTVAEVEGVDNPENNEASTSNSASLTISGGGITINNGGILRASNINLTGGTIAIQTGGQINANSPIYITDADADGWPLNFTLYTSTASGKRRLGLMRSYVTADCNDTNDYRVDNQCCVASTYYRDLDGDTYGNPLVSTSSCGAPAGYVSNNQDCGDTNANAKPGSTTCSTTSFTNNSGQSSFDWDCSNSGLTGTACGTTYYTPSVQWVTHSNKSGGYCNYQYAQTTIIGAPKGCGESGNKASIYGTYWGGYGAEGACGGFCPCANFSLAIDAAGTQACQ